MEKQIFLIGVAFEQISNELPASSIHEQQELLIKSMARFRDMLGFRHRTVAFRTGESMDEIITGKGTLLTLWDAQEMMTAFGVQVPSEQEGRNRLIEVKILLHELGIVLPISIHAFTRTLQPPHLHLVR